MKSYPELSDAVSLKIVFCHLTLLDNSFVIINHIDFLIVYIHLKIPNTIVFLHTKVIKSCQ